jgi:lactonase
VRPPLAPFGAVTAHHFSGPAPDTVRVDADGRVYVALYGQGRVLILSREGLPIGQVLLPGRDEGRTLSLTSLAIRPGSREMAIVSSDGGRGGSATIFRAEALGNGLALRTP